MTTPTLGLVIRLRNWKKNNWSIMTGKCKRLLLTVVQLKIRWALYKRLSIAFNSNGLIIMSEWNFKNFGIPKRLKLRMIKWIKKLYDEQMLEQFDEFNKFKDIYEKLSKKFNNAVLPNNNDVAKD
ncbi:hypothetical protein CEXT_5811 [Caerostris extrusa]|uniref:Uncharacterized protein n=1 Tax=Caerostris extrusa TaxID=172846 RepID=A0AAV4R967_CAEEX|nr:hypothetical protein CEXT_5811 [Caerostris extrusa]